MSNDHVPTRRDVLSGALGLAAGGLYPNNLQALSHDWPDTPQADHTPYRYAGRFWWRGGFPLGGGHPDRPQSITEAGFERYESMKYKRSGLHLERQEVTTSLPNPRSEGSPGTSYEILKRGDPDAVLYLAEVFNRWAQDMTSWAKAVRQDLLRIEDRLNLPHGDPGDPPPVPWK